MECGVKRAASRHPHRDGLRMLCAAEGVLVALRRCSLDDAFSEIVRTARQHNVAPLRLADALVAMAQGVSTGRSEEEAVDVAGATWGGLLETAPPSSCAMTTGTR